MKELLWILAEFLNMFGINKYIVILKANTKSKKLYKQKLLINREKLDRPSLVRTQRVSN